jgi:hypothetical protein
MESAIQFDEPADELGCEQDLTLCNEIQSLPVRPPRPW